LFKKACAPGGWVMVGNSKKGPSKTKKDEEVEMEYLEAELEPVDKKIKPKTKISPYRITSGESYMSDEQLSHFNKILMEWKRDLMEEVDHTITEMKEASVLADPNDRATQEETFNLELRTRDRERKLIKKIEEALQQIKDNEYGYCEACGIEIGIRRLEARPTATLCIDCKTLAEIQEKRA
jgi:DnaK suppressor protein